MSKFKTFEQFRENFLKKLDQEIKDSGITQREMIIGGFSPPNLHSIRKGKKDITIKTLRN